MDAFLMYYVLDVQTLTYGSSDPNIYFLILPIAWHNQKMCRGQDLNLQGLPHMHLKHARLPISPPRLVGISCALRKQLLSNRLAIPPLKIA